VRRNASIAIAVVLVAVAVAIVIGRTGLPPVAANEPGTFSFGVLGDAPYNPWEELEYRPVLRHIDAHDLAFVIHVGDIFWHPCTDQHYLKARDRLDHLHEPVIYTPGDNEWTDCWEQGSGGFAPRERLAQLRRIFFANPQRSLGRTRIALTSQGGEFLENVRWRRDGIVFATVHLVGSRNATARFPGRTAADDDEVRRRTDAAAAWTRQTFAEARATNASAVVLASQANLALGHPPNDRRRVVFEPFILTLEEEAERFGKPVLFAHGDGHVYTVDRPLIRRTTGRRLENVTRLQVPGSPEVGWVRVVVTPNAPMPFRFTKIVVPPWKYW
jgi:hypothetical protein